MSMGSLISVDEVNAKWEGKRQAEILGGRVFSDFLNGENKGSVINSSCSIKSIEKFRGLRKLAAKILSTKNVHFSHEEKVVAAKVLGKMDSFAFRPLNRIERKLISNINIPVSGDRLPFPMALTGKVPDAQYIICSAGIVVILSRQVKIKECINHKPQREYNVKKVSCGKYFYDVSFADFYRLFHYIKDSSGNGEPCLLTYYINPRHSLTSLFIIHTSKTILNFKTLITGVFS